MDAWITSTKDYHLLSLYKRGILVLLGHWPWTVQVANEAFFTLPNVLFCRVLDHDYHLTFGLTGCGKFVRNHSGNCMPLQTIRKYSPISASAAGVTSQSRRVSSLWVEGKLFPFPVLQRRGSLGCALHPSTTRVRIFVIWVRAAPHAARLFYIPNKYPLREGWFSTWPLLQYRQLIPTTEMHAIDSLQPLCS